MKYDLLSKIFLKVMIDMVKPCLDDKNIIKATKKEYKNIVLRAKDIGGSKNILISSYLLCAFFIALNRNDNLTAEENGQLLEKQMRSSKLLKSFMGNANGYFNEKRDAKRRAWAIESKNKKYENDWVLNFYEKSDQYEFGIDYLECGVYKLCRDENCPELAKYLCRLDYLLAEIMGVKLIRSKTLANGDDCCDFRYQKLK